MFYISIPIYFYTFHKLTLFDFYMFKKLQEELVRVRAEQSQPSITSPLTEQQVSVQVLGHRSGYLKGFGVRTKSSLASSQNQTGPDSEVQKLRQQVAEFSQRTIFLEGLVLQLA